MTPFVASVVMPLLRQMDPERAHGLALRALRLGLGGRDRTPDDPALVVHALGLRFPSPCGLAAGFDKDAIAVRPLVRLGFGFVEVGTATPWPQSGNPRPRLFRLTSDRAVINRMGFNNSGIEFLVARLAGRLRGPVPIGVNIGVNKEGADPVRDYPALLGAVAPFADYVVINVSSPNTPGLRDLQSERHLHAILSAMTERVPRRPPLLVKVAPDLPPEGLAAVVRACLDAGVEGLVISNTTLSRSPELRSPLAREAGGLSGAPLFQLSTANLARAYLLAGRRLCLIGAGGIFDGRDAFTKIQAGASLVQLYTAFAYAGPPLIPRLKSELAAAVHAEGFASVQDAVGTAAERLAGIA